MKRKRDLHNQPPTNDKMYRESQGLKEVKLIQKGKLPKKSARDFLKESRDN